MTTAIIAFLFHTYRPQRPAPTTWCGQHLELSWPDGERIPCPICTDLTATIRL